MSKKSKVFRYAESTVEADKEADTNLVQKKEDYKELDKGKDFTGGTDSSIASSPSTRGTSDSSTRSRGGE